MRNPFKIQNSDPENALLEMLRDQNKRLTEDTAWKQKRIEELTLQILVMKREGFHWTPPNEQEPGPLMDERIMVAIRSRSKEGSALEKSLYEHAQGLLIQEVEIEDVVDEILKGAQVE